MERKTYDYENETLETDEITNTDVKINPDFYIHLSLIKSLDALTKENVKEGHLQFIAVVNYMERICRAAGNIPDTYDKDIEIFISSLTEKEDFIRLVKIAEKKQELLTLETFSNRTLTTSLKT
jgi:hypothetical protein